MLTQLSPAMARVAVQARPQDLFLQKGSWVHFSNVWPGGEHEWATGKIFVVKDETIVVTFPVSYIVPENDYIDIDLTTAGTTFSKTQLALYPTKKGVLYQAGLGIKKGNFFVQLGIPAAQQYVYKLGQSFMYPNLADTNLKFLGKKDASDSPENTPLFFLYFINNQPHMFLRLYADFGQDFEKCGLVFYVNKCNLQLAQNPTPAMIASATRVPYYSELVEY
jgi:hypothetical protein